MPSSLNPNADPFPFTTPFIIPPPKLPFFKTPSRSLLWAPPLHAYGPYVGPFPAHHHHHHTLFGFYDVVPPLLPSWPCSDGFGGGVFIPQPGGLDGGEVKSGRKICKVKKWVPQVRVGVGVGDHEKSNIQFPCAVDDCLPLETTTLMIKNIPNQFRRHNLLDILDKHCKWKNLNSNIPNNSFDSRRSEYDFVYLPMDFRKYWYDRKTSNLGYAFVNFTSPTAASEFCKAYNQRQWDVSVNKKVCEIKRAKIQGLKALMEAFRNKVFWCHANNYLPVVLEPPSYGFHRRSRLTTVGQRVSRPPPGPIKKCG